MNTTYQPPTYSWRRMKPRLLFPVLTTIIYTLSTYHLPSDYRYLYYVILPHVIPLLDTSDANTAMPDSCTRPDSTNLLGSLWLHRINVRPPTILFLLSRKQIDLLVIMTCCLSYPSEAVRSALLLYKSRHTLAYNSGICELYLSRRS
jgi:hypothetical protein